MPYKTIPINTQIKNLTGSRRRTVTLWFYDGDETKDWDKVMKWLELDLCQ